MIFRSLVLSLCCSTILFSVAKEDFTLPWTTGPLLAPPGAVVEKGALDVEPYLVLGVETGVYDMNWRAHSAPNFYSLTPLVYLIYGITDWMDIQAIPQASYSWTQGASSFQVNDTPVSLGFQLITPNQYKYSPGVQLILTELFPIGKYKNLDPKKQFTDQGGNGSYATSATLVFYKAIHFSDYHYLTNTFSVGYTYFGPVHVTNLNSFGGGPGTKGRVKPGNATTVYLSFEYTLTKHWALALDNIYNHVNEDHFTGKLGMVSPGTPSSGVSGGAGISPQNSIGSGSSESFSFAPAVEYNFKKNMGIIAGVWFTGWGRNSSRFVNGLVAFNYIF